MGKINLLIANANQNFTDNEVSVFKAATKDAEKFIAKHFDFDYEVDLVIVTPSPLLYAIPEDGISGRTYHSRLIVVVIDKQHKKVNEDVVFETICHEMSHALRWEKVPEYAKTLRDGMVLEGLAVALEEKAMSDTGRKTRQYFLAEVQNTSMDTIQSIISVLGKSLNQETKDYETIFFTGNDTLPRWAGYKLGYYFVKEHLRKTGQSIEQSTLASYNELSSKI